MSAMFTEEDREKIMCQLIKIGYEIFESSTLKKTSVSEIAKRCGIAKGSFYNFFPSKHAYALALIQKFSKEKWKEFIELLGEREKMPLTQFMPWYRSLFTKENNIYYNLKVEDVLWLRDNMEDNSLFDPETDKQMMKKMMDRISGIKADIDYGVIVNFYKMPYALYQNRGTFCEEAIQKNIDLIVQTMYQYMKGEICNEIF